MNPKTSERTIRLSFAEVIRDALSVTWERRKPLATALLVPAGMIILFELLQMPFEAKKPLKSSALFLILELLKLLPFTILTISFHRIILRGHESVPKLGITKWTKRETRFFGWSLATSGLCLLVFFLCFIPIVFLAPSVFEKYNQGSGGTATHVLTYLLFLPAAYVLARIVLVFPATALDLRPTLSSASSLSKGNGWRLALLLFILPGLISLLFSALLGSVLPGGASKVLTILGTLLSYALFPLGVAILSTAYRHLLIVRSPGLSELVFSGRRQSEIVNPLGSE
jgi:hypothetical protein